MNYQRIYDELIASAVSRNWTKASAPCYTESHHIIPASLCTTSKRYGHRVSAQHDIDADEPSNLVRLTAKEHIMAHACLYKIYGNAMAFAFFSMANISPDEMSWDKLPNLQELYEQAKNAHSARRTELNLTNNPARCPKVRKKMSLAKKGVYDGENNPNYGNKGSISPLYGKTKITEDGRKRLSDSKLGKNNPNFIGIYHTPEGDFESTHLAAKHYQVNPVTISRRCRSKSFPDWWFEPKP